MSAVRRMAPFENHMIRKVWKLQPRDKDLAKNIPIRTVYTSIADELDSNNK